MSIAKEFSESVARHLIAKGTSTEYGGALIDAIGLALEEILDKHKEVHNHFHPGKDQMLQAVDKIVRIEPCPTFRAEGDPLPGLKPNGEKSLL